MPRCEHVEFCLHTIGVSGTVLCEIGTVPYVAVFDHVCDGEVVYGLFELNL